MKYPALFTPDPGHGFVVTFRDIPEAITQGDTEAEAMEMAIDALATALDFYFDTGRPIPEPSTATEEERPVPLAEDVAARVAAHPKA